jgi:hypothetical protein
MLPILKKNSVGIMSFSAGVICFLVYLKALTCGFVNWEDQDYVINNVLIRSLDLDFFIDAFTTTPVYGFWLPLTWVTFALDYYFWGLNPFGYHLTNIMIHSVNTGIVVLLASRLWKQSDLLKFERSTSETNYYMAVLLFVALLWGIHPARVESVVWVSERKDVLNGLFTISSVLFYLRYVQKKDALFRKSIVCREFVFSLLLFSMSLMSKSISVILPLVLLVIDWYPLGRLRKDNFKAVFVEKIPYFAFSIGIVIVTVFSRLNQDGFNSLGEFPLMVRLVASGNSIIEYLVILLLPFDILPYYHLAYAIPKIYVFKAIAFAVLFCIGIYLGKKKWWVTAIMLGFLIPLLPILHLTANGAQIIIAPRYTYLPSLIPGILITGMVFSIFVNTLSSVYRNILVLLSGALLVLYMVITGQLIGDWKDSGTMWSKVIAHQPFAGAYFYRGLFYVDSGQYSAAIDDYSKCLENTDQSELPDSIYAFRGEAFARDAKHLEAINDFNAAISIYPHQLYYYHRSLSLNAIGMVKEAAEDMEKAGNASGQMRRFVHGSRQVNSFDNVKN